MQHGNLGKVLFIPADELARSIQGGNPAAWGSFELKGGTGAITAMCKCGDFLEIYKVDKTFRCESLKSTDLREKNPNAKWIASQVADVGSGNPIIARMLRV